MANDNHGPVVFSWKFHGSRKLWDIAWKTACFCLFDVGLTPFGSWCNHMHLLVACIIGNPLNLTYLTVPRVLLQDVVCGMSCFLPLGNVVKCSACGSCSASRGSRNGDVFWEMPSANRRTCWRCCGKLHVSRRGGISTKNHRTWHDIVSRNQVKHL